MNRTAILAVLPLVFTSSAALAEASEDGAAHLVEVFQTYLGTSEGVVSVEVDGDAYTLTLDAAPLVAMATEAGGSASLTPMVMTLTDNGDGTWGVAQDQSLKMAFSIPGAADVVEEVGSMVWDGVFDEALMAFTSGKGEMTNIKVTETISDPNSGKMSVDVTVASATFEMIGGAGANGGTDTTANMTMTGLTETISTPSLEGTPPIVIAVTLESLTESVTVKGMRPDAIYKAIAWFVAHPTEDAMKAGKVEMKTILQEGLPLFEVMSGTGTATNLTVGSPMGPVSVAEISFAIDLNGVVADGMFREAFTLSGVTLPEGIIPPWAVPILPQKLSFDVQVTDFDPAAAAGLMLGLLDLPEGAEPDAAFDQTILAALLPNKTVTIGLNPGGVSGDGYELTYEGSMVVGPEMPIPTGTALITLTGIEKLQAALDAAPDDIKGQAMMGVGMAQGMAKADENGALVWEIDASAPGSLSVNGTQMMGGN